MAIGGFKAFKFTWAGGRTDEETVRSKWVLDSMVDGLIGLGQGWTRNSAFGESKLMAGGQNSYAQLLDHTNGSQMMLFHCHSGAAFPTESGLGPWKLFSYPGSSAAPCYPVGLSISMCAEVGAYTITDASGLVVALSEKATPILGMTGYSASNSAYKSFAKENSGSRAYSYSIVARDDVVYMAGRASHWAPGQIRCILCGDLVGTVAHESENWAKFGAICFSGFTNTETSSPIILQDEIYAFAHNLSETKASTTNIAAYIARQNSHGVSAGSNISGVVMGAEVFVTTVEMQTPSITGRFSPIWCGIASTNPAIHGVIPGDGFKGFFDTESICFTRLGHYTKGQTFDNGGRMYLGAGIVIGWDVSNTINIFD